MQDFDTRKAQEDIRRGKWIKNNGNVLRMINVLRTGYTPLNDLQYALPKLSFSELTDSINYLTEGQYIKLRHIDSRTETTLADAEFSDLEAKLSVTGIRLLAGKITDDCVGR